MSFVPQPAPAAPPPGGPAPRQGLAERIPGEGLGTRAAGLGCVVVVAAVMNTVRLSQNGYANIFYSAAVRSMLGSLHNFFFVSFDPGGIDSVDKPPLALWVQAASAKIFGLSPLSVLLPEALMGVLTVAVLYLIVVRRFGVAAAVISGIALAVFPSFVAVSRANGVDPLLILLLVLACGACVRACETGGWWRLLAAGALVGLAFNTKTLAAYLVVPALALAYLVCAPVSLPKRLLQLVAAGAVMGIVSFAWIAVVEATPASQRPYVGSSTKNTELGLTFEYNGFGRVNGQNGGPGQVKAEPGATVPKARQLALMKRRQREHPLPGPVKRVFAPSSNVRLHRNRRPIPFGGPPGPLRLFGTGLGDQGGWYLPFAFFGLIAVAMLLFLERRGRPGDRRSEQRGLRDPRLAPAIAFGGWFLTEGFVLSTSKGIVHPYYVSAIAPGAAAMVGTGTVALVALLRRRPPWAGIALLLAAVLGTLAAELAISHREHYLHWFGPVLVIGCAVCLAVALIGSLLRRPGAAAATAVALALLLVVPAGYASTTWLAPVEATFPAAGPRQSAGQGGVGEDQRGLVLYRALMDYVLTHGGRTRFPILTVASDTAAPMILLGMNAAAVGGYSGDDPALGAAGLARMVRRGEARYVLLGGEYSSRGGNGATRAALGACRELVPREWSSPVPYPSGWVLFDCGGRAAQIAAQA